MPVSFVKTVDLFLPLRKHHAGLSSLKIDIFVCQSDHLDGMGTRQREEAEVRTLGCVEWEI